MLKRMGDRYFFCRFLVFVLLFSLITRGVVVSVDSTVSYGVCSDKDCLTSSTEFYSSEISGGSLYFKFEGDSPDNYNIVLYYYNDPSGEDFDNPGIPIISFEGNGVAQISVSPGYYTVEISKKDPSCDPILNYDDSVDSPSFTEEELAACSPDYVLFNVLDDIISLSSGIDYFIASSSSSVSGGGYFLLSQSPVYFRIPGYTGKLSGTVTDPLGVVSDLIFPKLPLAGDVNGDGQVGMLDYNLVKVNFGKEVPRDCSGYPSNTDKECVGADVSGDGQIGMLDYNLVKVNFGNTDLAQPPGDTAIITLTGVGEYKILLNFLDSDGNFLYSESTSFFVGTSASWVTYSGDDSCGVGNIKTDTGCFVDIDGDLVPDSFDNCPNIFNPAQEDSDNNGMGDICQIGTLDYIIKRFVSGETSMDETLLGIQTIEGYI